MVFTETTGTDTVPLGNDTLRVTDHEGPFAAALDRRNRVDIFMNVGDLEPGDAFTGGFQTMSAEDFVPSVAGADFRFLIADTEGMITHRGQTYRPYDGPLAPVLETVSDGAGGRVLRVSWHPLSYALWRDFRFSGAEDPTAGDPLADPGDRGMTNLMRYALGETPWAGIEAKEPRYEMDGDFLAITFRRDPAKTDIAYVVEASDDLSDWSHTLYDSRFDSAPNTDGDSMRVGDTVILSGDTPRFLRLRVLLW